MSFDAPNKPMHPNRRHELSIECAVKTLLWIRSQVTNRKNREGQFAVEYDGKRYACRVVLDRKQGAEQAEVTWS